MNEVELKQRTKSFALRAIQLASALPNTAAGRAVASQFVRCGTSVGANYRAACRGRSPAEFVAKLGIVEEEADEAGFWLELIVESGMLEPHRVNMLLDESRQLTRIISASRITASRSLSKRAAHCPDAPTNQNPPSANRKLKIEN